MPRLGATACIHSAAADGGQEALGMRLIDRPREVERHERRDSRAE